MDNGRSGQLDRARLIEELDRRYGSGRGRGLGRLRFIWKKYAWLGVVRVAGLLKRTLDVLVAGTLLILLIPLFLVVAAAIKLTDGGPVLFWQTRVGKWGREIPFPKFRSMVVNAEEIKKRLMADSEDPLRFKMKRDPRITWIGRIIRKFSIDELPQLWSVLVGDMSLVGPRAPLPAEVERYSLAERRRLDVVPGLTCFWQVGGRSEIPFEQQVALDVRYIESQSFWLDLKLLWLTVPAVLLGKGAY